MCTESISSMQRSYREGEGEYLERVHKSRDIFREVDSKNFVIILSIFFAFFA